MENEIDNLRKELTALQQENAGLLERDNQWRKELAALQQELAEVRLNHEQLNDALVSARAQLGKDELPFVCDSICKIQNERDNLRVSFRDMMDANARLLAQNDRLQEALKEYGEHRAHCATTYQQDAGKLPPSCTCGLQVALNPTDQRER